jgi:hypothetical protein
VGKAGKSQPEEKVSIQKGQPFRLAFPFYERAFFTAYKTLAASPPQIMTIPVTIIATALASII